jgi:hypothetical protein
MLLLLTPVFVCRAPRFLCITKINHVHLLRPSFSKANTDENWGAARR